MDSTGSQNNTNIPDPNFVGIFKKINTDGRTVFFYILNVFLIFYYVISLICLCRCRDWYIIKQRNFILTFIGGCANFISTLSNSVTDIMKIPCAVSYYSATVFTSISQICFVARAIRLILLYKLNIFKVTELNQKKFTQNTTYAKKGAIMEPNIYYKSIYKMVDKTFVRTIIIGYILILTGISIFMQAQYGKKCGLGFTNITEKISQSNKNNKNNGSVQSSYDMMQKMFMIPVFIGILFIFVNIIITFIFLFTKIRDDQRMGIKFDCFSNSVVHLITETIYFVLKASKGNKLQVWKDLTKDGIYLFVLCGIYLHFTSVIIPLIKVAKAKRLEKKYANEPTNTIQYFYKILNSPNLVEELKAIAIQDFVVENVLFWENYCTLQKLVVRAKQKQDINADSSSSSHHQKINLQDIYSNNSGSHDEESYDPNYPLMPQLVPYYNAFYHTFIDVDGPAAVNISGSTIRRIYHDFYTYPTVGIFDEAKDEVVDSMFISIFPALLQNNRKQLGELYSHNP